MSSYLFLASLGFLLAFLLCFRPFRVIMRPLFATLGLFCCNALGIGVGINIITVCFVTFLGIPGFFTLIAIYTLL